MFSTAGSFRSAALIITLLLHYAPLVTGSGTADGADAEQRLLYRVEIALLATATLAAVVGASVAVAHFCVGQATAQAAALAAAAPPVDPVWPAEPGQAV